MTVALVRKLLRDVRWPLLVVMLLLAAFQCLWVKITQRTSGELIPLFLGLASAQKLSPVDLEGILFKGPGKIMQTLMGGEAIQIENAMHMLSIGYVHPLMQTIFCIWAIGRASGAIAGEIDRGTMELLLAQPLARSRLILAQLLLDATTIPLLCLSLWAGNWIGAWAITPIQVEEPHLNAVVPKQNYLLEIGPFKLRLEDPVTRRPRGLTDADRAAMRERLRVEPIHFARALVVVAGLIFAVCGITMWLSSAGRFRWRVLGFAVFLMLVQFLVNLLGSMWDEAAWLRPLTIFYYYQPQQLILTGDWCVTWSEWNGGSPLVRLPMPAVLFGVGLLGYALALWTLVRRDLPAPL